MWMFLSSFIYLIYIFCFIYLFIDVCVCILPISSIESFISIFSQKGLIYQLYDTGWKKGEIRKWSNEVFASSD